MTQKVYDVVRYGAVADGATDSTARIQSAVDAASAAGGGTVFIPNGSYVITEPIVIKSNVDIVGASQETTITLSGTGESSVLSGSSASRFSLANLTIVGNRQTVNDATTANGVSLSACNFFSINNVRVQECQYGFYLSGCWTCHLSRCNAIRCEEYGYYGGTTLTSAVFDCCLAWGCGGGFRLIGAIYCTLNAPVFELLSAGNHPSDPFLPYGSGGDYQAPDKAFYIQASVVTINSPGGENCYTEMLYAEGSQIVINTPYMYNFECHATGAWRFINLRGTSNSYVEINGPKFSEVTNETTENFLRCGLYVENVTKQQLVFNEVPAIDSSFGAYEYATKGIYERPPVAFIDGVTNHEAVRQLRVSVDASAGGSAQTTAIGTVPQNAIIHDIHAYVGTAFDGDTTTTFEVGVTGNTDKYIDPVDFDPSVADTALSMLGGSNNDQQVSEYCTADVDIIATWTNTASAAAGNVTVVVTYTPKSLI